MFFPLEVPLPFNPFMTRLRLLTSPICFFQPRRAALYDHRQRVRTGHHKRAPAALQTLIHEADHHVEHHLTSSAPIRVIDWISRNHNESTCPASSTLEYQQSRQLVDAPLYHPIRSPRTPFAGLSASVSLCSSVVVDWSIFSQRDPIHPFGV